jgi:hypothetical protein
METPKQQANVDEPELTETTIEVRSGQKIRRATGPRTAAGKRRSRYNAVKSGIFAKGFLLKNESPSDYDLLQRRYYAHYRPQGLETELVGRLAWNCWRRRRISWAERAQIEEAAEFKTCDFVSAQEVEAWDHSRAGESSGGMLRYSSNLFVIHEAIDILTAVRLKLEKCGFTKDEDPWFLRKLYGLDHDRSAPNSLFRMYLIYSKLATAATEESGPLVSPDELKENMLEMFDWEIQRLGFLGKDRLAAYRRKGEYQTTAALIPTQGDLDRIIRYEAHLTREDNQILSQLERLQRIRLGQPAPPTIRLET